MGGEGSGRTKEIVMSGEVLMNNEQFKAALEQITVGSYFEVLQKVLEIIKGERKDFVYDSKAGRMIKREVSNDTVIKAAKVYKELTLDKVVSDKKEIGDKDSGDLFAYVEALKSIEDGIMQEKAAKKKALEDEAIQAGKLTRLTS